MSSISSKRVQPLDHCIHFALKLELGAGLFCCLLYLLKIKNLHFNSGSTRDGEGKTTKNRGVVFSVCCSSVTFFLLLPVCMCMH